MTSLEFKYKQLVQFLKDQESVAVAFSGGVDSTLLAKAAFDALGEQAVAITALGPMIPEFEKKDAEEMVSQIGIQHVTFPVDIDAIPHFSENNPDRCYHCKTAIFTRILVEAKKLGIKALVDGSNLDDDRDYRPGKKALVELKVISPLVETGWTKSDIRAYSKYLGLKTHDKPNYACLASRVPYGEVIDAKKLVQIDQAEEVLRNAGFKQFRVRHHGNLARLEMSPEEMTAILDQNTLIQLSESIKNIGFSYVALDMEGYKTGSLNRDLTSQALEGIAKEEA